MCIANDQLDRRSRWLRALAVLALIAGLLLWNFGRSAGKSTGAWFDATAGLLMGFSIATNLLMLRRAQLKEPRRLKI